MMSTDHNSHKEFRFGKIEEGIVKKASAFMNLLLALFVASTIQFVQATPQAPTNGAQFVSQSVPTSLQPGETRNVSITMKNSGLTTWTQAGDYKLGTQNPQDNTLWLRGTRVYLSAFDAVKAGETKTFSFDITAPTTPGTYNFQWRMVQDGVGWFGTITPNVQITVKAPTNGTLFVSQSVPTTLQRGEKRSVAITMKNSGTTTWTQAGEYKLGTQNPQDNILWTGSTRIYLSPTEAIKPGESKTFTFDITAPNTPGAYNFQWRMVQDGVEWFGANTLNAKITVEAPNNNAQFISQSDIFGLLPGEVRSVAITMKNTGSTTWTRGGEYKLGTQNPPDNTLWTGSTRLYLAENEAIKPGDSKTFTFNVTAPASLGTYNFQWRMVQDGVAWFGDYTPTIRIKVDPPANNAQFISQSVPAVLRPGEKKAVSITMKNIGTSTWSRSGDYKLGTQSPQDNTLWTGYTRVYFAENEAVKPGDSKTFTFDITAPNASGIYNFQWRMVQDGVGWFGDLSRFVAISVTPGGVEPPVTGPNFPVRPGLWPASAEESSTDDLDGDGMPQNREMELARAFFPTIWYDRGEDNTWPGYNGQYGPHAPGRLVFRVRPHPLNRDYLAITYVLLYTRDGGELLPIGCPPAPPFVPVPHAGDVEPFGITLAPNPACELGYGIVTIRTWAHEDSPYYTVSTDFLYSRCTFGFSIDPTGRNDIVLASENKHGNYLSDDTCDKGICGAENCNLHFTLGNVNAWVGFNAGEPGSQRHNDLGPLGFPGEQIWSGKKFCGGGDCGFGSPGPVKEKLELFAPALVLATPLYAEHISQSVPNQLKPGEKANVSITVKNSGSKTWTQTSGFKLGTNNPEDNTIWTGNSRLELAASEVIASGQNKTFNFEVTAPTTPGMYGFQWRMFNEGTGWFGEETPNVSIMVDRGMPCPPTVAPAPSGPSGTIINSTPTFVWGAVPGANSYTLYLLKTSDESVVLRQTDIMGTSFAPASPLPKGVDLRWKVKSESSCGSGPYSPSVAFRIDEVTPCPPVASPETSAPSGNIGSTTPTFSWTAVPGASSYTLYIIKMSDESVVLRQTTLTGLSFAPSSPLPVGIELRWKVKSESTCGPGPYSPSISFRIGQTPPPCPPTAAPNPGEPSGSINNQAPTFSWSAVPGANSYTLYVLKLSDESVVLRQTNITGTAFTPTSPLPRGIDLRWKVKSESSCGPGPYSPSVLFKVN